MEPVDDVDPLVRVTWHIEESLLRWLTDQSRESGVPKAKIARRLLAEGMVRHVMRVQEAGEWQRLANEPPEVILPPGEFPPGEDVVMAGWVVEKEKKRGGPEPAGAEGEAPPRAKVRHHDDAVIGGGALVKCRRCLWVKNAARPEVCDG